MTAFSSCEVGGYCVDGFFRQVEQSQKDGPMKITTKNKGFFYLFSSYKSNTFSSQPSSFSDLVPPYIRAHLVGNGTTLAVLTKEGEVKMIDLLVLMEVRLYD